MTFNVLALVAGAYAAIAATTSARTVLEPFDYRGVKLNDSIWKLQADKIRAYYLQIPNDDLLLGFRQRAGLPSPGKPLGGWYSSDTFHVFGQILGGLARFYGASGDAACKAKAEYLLAEWAKTIQPDGFFFYSRNPNARHYVYEKMVGGLLDMYQYCGSTEALPCLRRITDWAEQNLGRGRGYAFNAGNGETEWYTLSENLYRAYLLTDDPRYRDFAAVWEYRDFWNHFAHQTSIFPPQTNLPTVTRYHAYSHVNALSGAAAAYLVSGEQHYLDTLVNAYEFIQTDLCYATGGFGPDEDWTPREALSAKLRTSHNSFETQCGSWAAFKMTRYLIRLTGDGRYGDWTERILYNGIGTTIPMAPDGSVQYFSDYNIAGGRKSNHNAWSCCTGTRPQAAADYANLVYFHGPASLHVNLYLPATVEWTCGLVPVTVAMQTSFPAEEQVEFTVHCKEPVSFALKFRMPGWLAGPAQAAVNGAPAPLVLDDRHWGALERRWHDGDRVSLTLPMRFRISRFGSDTDAPYALLRGPVVLAAESPEGNPAEWLKPQAATNLQQALIPCPGTPMTWRLKANAEVLFKPYYAYRQNEPYFLYLSPRPDDILRFSGDWHFGGNLRYCNEPGATVHMVFEGTGVRWLGNRFDDAGQAAVCIDGRPVAVVDQYGAGRNLPFEWKYEGLPAGKHEITLTVRKERNASSVNSYVNILGFERLQ